ncbi:MAG: 2-dehydropantoate 2-reductase [Thermoplasmata archaeon]|nr:2-dehydropantoate 2-reductase [Thermoplasmata archaeon]
MRVSVLGAGAIGCALGAALAPHAEVELVARGAHLAALREKGLTLDGRTLRLAASDRVTPGADLVIAAVKTQDLEAALAASRDAIGPAPVMTIQNGLAAEGLAALHVPEVVGCVTALDAEFLEPGVVTVGRVGGLVLSGRPDLAALFAKAGIPARVTRSFAGARWTKLLVNLNNTILAATGLTAQEAYARADLPRLSVRVVKEGLAVARAEGVRLEAIPWANPRQVAMLTRLPEPLAARLLAARVLRDAGAIPLRGSTQQSLMRGRGVEVAYLNGEIVRRGARHGIATPANDALVAAVEKVAASGQLIPPASLAALA